SPASTKKWKHMKAASCPRSSSLALIVAAGALALAGCVDHEPGISGPQSLVVTISSPTDLGSSAVRLPDSTRTFTFDVQAMDEMGTAATGYSATLQVYAFSLGALSDKLTSVALQNGAGHASVTLPTTYGQTYLWIEDAQGD